MSALAPQRTALCVFHQEKKASLKINLERKIFHCFGCGASGNILDFVSKLEGCSIQDAAAIIAECCNLEGMAERGEAPRKPASAQAAPPATMVADKVEMATPASPAGELPAGKAVDAETAGNPPLTFALKLDPEHPYLAERGLSPELVKLFGLGYCNRGLMKGRICIPIHDHLGHLVAYAGRWPGDPPEGEEKYKLPPAFKKTAVLYNLNRVREAKHLTFVEGYFGTFRLHALGIPAVALMGRSIDPAQVELLDQSAAERATLLLDGNEPGRTGALAVLPLLSRRLFVRLLTLPEGSQPDTVAEEWLAPLRALV